MIQTSKTVAARFFTERFFDQLLKQPTIFCYLLYRLLSFFFLC